MKLRKTLFTLLCVASLTASAIPARRGVVHQMQQPDGTIVNLELVGDEHTHYYLTTDGKVVLAVGSQYFYARLDDQNRPVCTDVLAHNPAERSMQEKIIVDGLNAQDIKESILYTPLSRANNQDGKGNISNGFPTKGTVKSLVFLVSYSDVDFTTDNPQDYFTRLLNEEGFSENGACGSAYDYYYKASMGQFIGEFDVYGPVKLPEERAYYGGNNGNIIDIHAKEMLLHAGQLLDDEIDFSQYDLDGDKFVDNVYIIYAGGSEADGAGADCVWPHQSSVGMNTRYRFDGVQLNRYACGSELSGKKPDGIGTFCHEFGHVLGLPDLYNVNDMTVNYTPLSYSLMDQGCYNDGGNRPPTLSAFERNALKWMGDNLVEITGPASCRLEHLEESNMAYLINTDKVNEYFLFENRQQQGWDKKLPGHGMIIWHIDYDRTTFNRNLANADKNHQRVDIVEANGTTSLSTLQQRKYPFPGPTNKHEFIFGGTPDFKTWSGVDLGLPITNIQEVDGVITFDVAGGGPDPAGIADVVVEKDFALTVDGRKLSVLADGLITVCDLSGRVVATANGELTTSLSAPGLYIVATPAGTRKLMIK